MKPIAEFVNRVICGDCTEVMREMPDGCVDLVVTDPPYGARYRDRAGRRVANDDNLLWLLPAFAQAARVLKRDRFCVSFYGWHRADRFLLAWKAAGLRPVGHFVFVKPYPSNAGSGFIEYRHEAAYLLAKGSPDRPRYRLTDVLPWQYTGNRYHPTEKPVSAIAPLIEDFSRPDDIVLDPFAGSGTTALAAKELGRRYIAIELDMRHAHTARERLKVEENQNSTTHARTHDSQGESRQRTGSD